MGKGIISQIYMSTACKSQGSGTRISFIQLACHVESIEVRYARNEEEREKIGRQIFDAKEGQCMMLTFNQRCTCAP